MIYSITLSFLLISFSAFGANHTTSSFPDPMKGVWETICHQDGDFYQYREFEIHEDVWVMTEWFATDRNCLNIALEKQTTYEVTLNSELWNGKSLMVYIRPYLQSLANKFNQENLCGHQNWKHGRIIEVTGLDCNGFKIPNYNQILYSIYKTEGPRKNILYIGTSSEANDGSSAEKRHLDFSPLILIRNPQALLGVL